MRKGTYHHEGLVDSLSRHVIRNIPNLTHTDLDRLKDQPIPNDQNTSMITISSIRGVRREGRYHDGTEIEKETAPGIPAGPSSVGS
jgi:hypothetical protein